MKEPQSSYSTDPLQYTTTNTTERAKLSSSYNQNGYPMSAAPCTFLVFELDIISPRESTGSGVPFMMMGACSASSCLHHDIVAKYTTAQAAGYAG